MDNPEHSIMWDKAQILDREDNWTRRIKDALRIRDSYSSTQFGSIDTMYFLIALTRIDVPRSFPCSFLYIGRLLSSLFVLCADEDPRIETSLMRNIRFQCLLCFNSSKKLL